MTNHFDSKKWIIWLIDWLIDWLMFDINWAFALEMFITKTSVQAIHLHARYEVALESQYRWILIPTSKSGDKGEYLLCKTNEQLQVIHT